MRKLMSKFDSDGNEYLCLYLIQEASLTTGKKPLFEIRNRDCDTRRQYYTKGEATRAFIGEHELTSGRVVTEEMARDVLDIEYRHEVMDTVQGIVAECFARQERGQTPDLGDIVHEAIDGHHDVIYTREAQRVLLCSENSDAWEELGSEGATWSTMAYCAMRADVESELARMGFNQDNLPTDQGDADEEEVAE